MFTAAGKRELREVKCSLGNNEAKSFGDPHVLEADDSINVRVSRNSQVGFSKRIRSTESTALHPVGQAVLNSGKKKQEHLQWIINHVNKSGSKFHGFPSQLALG